MSQFGGTIPTLYLNGSVQERHNSIANALELHLSCTNPSICCCKLYGSLNPFSKFQRGHPEFDVWNDSMTQPWQSTGCSYCCACKHAAMCQKWALIRANSDCISITILVQFRHSNTLSGLHFANDIFKCIHIKENACILIGNSLRCVLSSPIINKSALV